MALGFQIKNPLGEVLLSSNSLMNFRVIDEFIVPSTQATMITKEYTSYPDGIIQVMRYWGNDLVLEYASGFATPDEDTYGQTEPYHVANHAQPHCFSIIQGDWAGMTPTLYVFPTGEATYGGVQMGGQGGTPHFAWKAVDTKFIVMLGSYTF